MTLTATNATSYTDLQTFGRCPNKYRYRSILQIQPKQRDQKLKIGTLTHRFMMEGYLGKPFFDMYDEEKARIDGDTRLFAEEVEAEMAVLDTSWRITLGYFEFYRDDWEILHVEETFLIMLENGEVISFTPDLVVRDRDGFVWIVDHKTTDAVPTAGVPFADLQALLYFAGVKALYPELRGFIFNYLRKKEPTEPRLNKTHNAESKAFGHYFVNNLKSIDTTFELLRNFLESEAPALLDEPAHKQRLAELLDNPRFYWRDKIIVTPDEVSRLLDDVTAQIGLVRLAREHGYFPRVFQGKGVQSCEGCGYRRICQAELLGWDTEIVLQEHYEPRDDSYKEYEVAEDE